MNDALFGSSSADISWGGRLGLPWIGCQAAIELDRIAAGEEVNPKAVADLAAMLSSRSRKMAEPPPELGLTIDSSILSTIIIDPTIVAVIKMALDDASTQTGRLYHGSSLLDQVTEVSADLGRVAMDQQAFSSDRVRLEEMRDFCMALSKTALANDQSIYDASATYAF